MTHRQRGPRPSHNLDTTGSVDDLVERGWRATVFPYEDRDGVVIYEKVRLEIFDSNGVRVGKTFRQRHYDNEGKAIENLKGIEPVPYRLLDVLAETKSSVWWVEGEKCADAITRTGRTATYVAKWSPEMAEIFRARNVVIAPDNDAPGDSQARRAEEALRGIAKSVRIVRPPVLDHDRAVGWDIADYLEAGGTMDVLEGMINPTPDRDGGPLWWDEIQMRSGADYLIKGVLYQGDCASVYGPSYSGKSHFVLDVAVAVATGQPWNGHRVRQTPVLYIGLEGARGLANRLIARRMQFDANHGAAGDRVPLSVWSTSLDLSTPVGTADLIQKADELSAEISGRIGLIVIDTMARALGAGDENSNVGIGALLSNVALVQRATGACVLLVHHVGKEAAKGPRGHSSFFAALDTAIEITRHTDGIAIASVTKQKDGDGGLSWRFRIVPATLGVDDDGDPVTAGIAEFLDFGTTGERAEPTGISRVAMQTLNRLLATIGEPAAGLPGLRDGQPTIAEAEWRSECLQVGLGQGTLESDKRAFKRAIDALTLGNHVGRVRGRVWRNENEVGQTRTGNGQVHSVHRTDMDVPLKGTSDVRDKNDGEVDACGTI